MKAISGVILFFTSTLVLAQQRPPIIDMHMHAAPIESPAHVESVTSKLKAGGIVRVTLSVDGPGVIDWHKANPKLFWVGPSFPCYGGHFGDGDPCWAESNGWPDLDWLRRQFEEDRLQFMGELYYDYYGIPPTDPRLDPYWALAAELDIPVGIHTGRRPKKDLPQGCCPHYDDDYGDPSLLAPVLERYPELRIWLMHAPGDYEWVDDTIDLMRAYPNVYAELSVTNYFAPEPAYAIAVRAFLDADLGERIMLGTDNQPLDRIIERTEAIDFMTSDQKHAYYCENAARFLGLEQKICGG